MLVEVPGACWKSRDRIVCSKVTGQCGKADSTVIGGHAVEQSRKGQIGISSRQDLQYSEFIFIHDKAVVSKVVGCNGKHLLLPL